MKESVLVLDCETRSALAVVRSLGRAGFKVVCASAEEYALASASRFASQKLTCPAPSVEPAPFQAWLLEAVKRLKPSMVLPLTNASLELALKLGADLTALVKFPFVSEEDFQAVNNKARLVDIAAKVGMPAPQTITIPNQNARTPQIDQAIRSFRYPAVLKPAYSDYRVNSKYLKAGVCYPHDASEVFQIIDGKKDPQLSYLPFLLQERIVGEGVGVFALCKDGEILASFCHRRILEKPPSGGVSVLSESIAREEVPFEQTAAILRHLHWQGVAMVEFKRDAHGRHYLIEINPRFWGSLQLAISSGCNFPLLLWNMMSGETIAPHPNDYEVGRRLRWVLGTLDHVYLRLKEDPISAVQDFFTKNSLQLFKRPLKTTYDVWAWDDPKPLLVELRNYFFSQT